ncbi:MAG: transglutaminase domain-containing protein, partial [Proteobacteria bacterium]|nr:transglutaminase domain-containing protein [Pseudomonadota bacterium]
RTVFTQDREGRTLAISATTQTGRFLSRTDVRVDGATARIVNQTPTGRWAGTAVLNESVRFDGGEGLLAGWSPAATPRLEFDNFNVDAMSMDHVVIEARPQADATGAVSALRFEYHDGGLVGVTQLVMDRGGRLIESAQPMFGQTIHLRVTDQRTALAPHLPYPLIPNAAMRSPVRIAAGAAQGHIRYSVSFRDGIAFALPQTGEQRVTQQGGEATVDICADCGPGLGTDRAVLADALRPTAWMQSDNPRLRAIVAPVAAMAISDTQKMRLLLQRAKPYIARPDYAGHYSALDTIARRAGDCTEAAVLLAALGRAAGIPTRVASGLAYARQAYFGVSNAFMPHSWTLAYVDGRWRSFDLALENFDSTHIVLTIGNGDARSIAAASQLASLVRFDSLVEVRAGS